MNTNVEILDNRKIRKLINQRKQTPRAYITFEIRAWDLSNTLDSSLSGIPDIVLSGTLAERQWKETTSACSRTHGLYGRHLRLSDLHRKRLVFRWLLPVFLLSTRAYCRL